MRRPAAELETETLDALREALAEVGLCVEEVDRERHFDRLQLDAMIRVNDTLVGVEVKSVVTEQDAQHLAQRFRRTKLPVIVAAERIAEPARLVLRREGFGYFDRRGQLRLVVPGSIVIDTAVGGSARPVAAVGPLDGGVAKEVGLVLLESPGELLGVREIARRLERSPSSVLTALARLRGAGLATSANEPLVPELFWELASVWRRERLALAKLPQPGDRRTAERLQLGLGEIGPGGVRQLDPIGWAVSDTAGALAWGLPLVASSDYPPDFYVPGPDRLRLAEAFLGRAEDVEGRACTAASAPVPYVCRRRVSMEGSTWPVASAVVVALDLAQDRARGREVLERWSPPAGVARVW